MAGMMRCAYLGSMSHGQRGEGPWFCRHHFFCDSAAHGERILEASREAA
jgi:hypothetical protein